jgi:hypothetical protein
MTNIFDVKIITKTEIVRELEFNRPLDLKPLINITNTYTAT